MSTSNPLFGARLLVTSPILPFTPCRNATQTLYATSHFRCASSPVHTILPMDLAAFLAGSLIAICGSFFKNAFKHERFKRPMSGKTEISRGSPAVFVRLACVVLLLACSALAMRAEAQPLLRSVVTTERARAELLAHAPEGVEPGKTLWVGLQLAHQPDWHTYWKNSGDSGLPTQFTWTLPPGVEAGEIAWPIPKKYPIGNLANYGYSGTVLLPVPLTVTPRFKPSLLGGDLEIKLKAQWLICRKECVPEEGEFALKIPARSSTALHTDVFNASFQAQPRPLASAGTVRIDGSTLKVSVPGLPARREARCLGSSRRRRR